MFFRQGTVGLKRCCLDLILWARDPSPYLEQPLGTVPKRQESPSWGGILLSQAYIN